MGDIDSENRRPEMDEKTAGNENWKDMKPAYATKTVEEAEKEEEERKKKEAEEAAKAAKNPKKKKWEFKGITQQRVLVLAFCAGGILGSLLPWATVDEKLYDYVTGVSSHGIVWGFNADGKITLMLFVLMILFALMGRWEEPFKLGTRVGETFFGAFAAFIPIYGISIANQQQETYNDVFVEKFGASFLDLYHTGAGSYIVIVCAIGVILCSMLMQHRSYIAEHFRSEKERQDEYQK